jgi:hypothetical protein
VVLHRVFAELKDDGQARPFGSQSNSFCMFESNDIEGCDGVACTAGLVNKVSGTDERHGVSLVGA